MMEPEWKSLPNEAGESEGLGDAGIETFRDTPYSAHAREGGQNTRDASKDLPVILRFDRLIIPQEDFPGRDTLQSTLEACRKGTDQDREVEFFDNALRVISQPEIPVLRMSDTNTTGLIGPPDREGTAFHSLVKASGVTAKEKTDSGGSFGIGKNAAFAISELQTVFYSTLYDDPDTGEQKFSAQGKAKLVSHVTNQGEKYRATSYWGISKGFEAVTDQNLVPAWMARNEIGTSVFSMGFRSADDWAERMSYSLVANFFAAIYRDEMVFEVDNEKYHIHSGTVEALLESCELIAAAERAGHKADLDFAKQLFRCIASDAAEENILEIDGIGKIRVRILVDENMPKRVGIVRNGMLIADNLRHFGDKLARFTGSRDFIAVVEPYGKGESGFLKRLENPAHDGFSSERISDEAKRNQANSAMRKLAKKLRQLIKKTTGVKHEGAVQIEELGHFFAEKALSDEDPSTTDEKNPERYRYKPAKRKQKRTTTRAKNQGEKGGSGGSGNGGSGGQGAGSRRGGGVGGHGPHGEIKPVKLENIRNKVPNGADCNHLQREIFFTSPVSGKAIVKVFATGVNNNVKLKVVKSDIGNVKGGDFELDLNKGERKHIIVNFDEPYDGPLELTACSAEPADQGGSSETI